MSRRLQILIDEARYQLLQDESSRSGRAIAELIREAVDARFGVDHDARKDAYDVLLAAEPMPVGDWASEKADLVDSHYGQG